MIITLAGYPGSGKSTVRTILGERLGWKTYSIGDLYGKFALERGITIDALSQESQSIPDFDHYIDDYQRNLGKSEDNVILDGSLSWHFVPNSFKILLTVDEDEAARRIFTARKTDHARSDEPEYASVEETRRILAERVAKNAIRYKKWYGLDPLKSDQFDLILDTTHETPTSIVEKIMGAIA